MRRCNKKKVKTIPSTKPKVNINDFKQFLPIGSVVRLNNDQKYLIFGIAQSNHSSPYDQYDYIGVEYPDGLLLEENQHLFDHTDIKEICHTGYVDEDYNSFIDMMDSMMHM